MTVEVQVPYTELIGNGVSTSFGYPFMLPSASWLSVYLNGVLQVAGFTVQGLNNPSGGTILFSVPPANGALILLRRTAPLNQQVDLQPYDAFPAQTVEDSLNKLTMISQQDKASQDGSIHIPFTELPNQQNMVLPAAGDRANLLVGFDAYGNVVTYPLTGGGGGGGVTAHNQLTGLTLGNDHPQYLLALDAAMQYLALTGGTLTGPLVLVGNPTAANQAANKAYVDTFTGSVIATNINSNVTGDAQPTVFQAWNAQANAGLITRAANEIIYYRWPSTLNNVYRYLGAQQGPSGWASTALDWPSSAGIADAPVDGVAYARKDAGWTPATLALATGAATPATLTADTDNYAPAGFSTASELRLSTDASRNLTGITGGTVGRLIFIHNVGSFNLVLKDEGGTSTAANRFALPADLTLLPDTACILQYDNTSQRWRLLGGSGSGGAVKQQDAEPTMVKGELWFDSDSGTFSLRYQNPDLTFTNVGLNGAGSVNPVTPAPTRQVFLTGSGTYTPPVGCRYIDVQLIGAGGSGGGGGGTAGSAAVSTGTTFGTLTGNPGGPGVANVAAPTVGGTATGGDINVKGAAGQGATGAVSIYAGRGGSSLFGSGGLQNSNTPAYGAGGDGGASTTPNTGGGGAAGGYVKKLITALAVNYAYSVGAPGAAGVGTESLGTQAGFGIIIIDEYY